MIDWILRYEHLAGSGHRSACAVEVHLQVPIHDPRRNHAEASTLKMCNQRLLLGDLYARTM